MKSNIIKSLKIFFWMAFVLALGTSLYLGYVFSKFNQDINDEKLQAAAEEIKKAEKLDISVVNMYNRIYNDATQNTSIEHAWQTLLGNKIECPCYNVTRRLHINKRHKLTENSYAIATRLESKVSQIECLNFLFMKFDYLYGAKGFEEAAFVYFNKPSDMLNEDELIGLIILQENPAFYSPKRHRARFDKEINEVKERIKL